MKMKMSEVVGSDVPELIFPHPAGTR